MISNSSPNTSLGREVFFHHYQERSQEVKQAFQQFDQEVSLMDNRFGILETLSSHEFNQVFTYNSNEHKFSACPLNLNQFLMPISSYQRDAYTKDYLIHVLIPSLVKSILGENGKSDDKQALTEFIQYKLLDGSQNRWNADKWQKLDQKVQQNKLVSAEEKVKRVHQKNYEKTPEGQIEKKQKSLDDLNQCLFTTENILKIFENINLDVLKKGLQDSTQAPTFSANMSQFKQRLIALIDKIIAKNVTEKDFLETSDPESNQILNVPDKWKDLAVFKEFQTSFALIMKKLATKQTQIAALKREIERLQETLPKSKPEPIQLPIPHKSVNPQTIRYVRQDNSSNLANLWHSISRKVHDFALIIWQQLMRAWNWLAS